MDSVSDTVQLDVIAILPEPGSVGFALVAQGIEFRGDDQRARLALEIVRHQRREIGTGQIFRPSSGIKLQIVPHPLGGEDIVGAVLPDGSKGRIFAVVVVGGGINEDLLPGQIFAAVAHHE